MRNHQDKTQPDYQFDVNKVCNDCEINCGYGLPIKASLLHVWLPFKVTSPYNFTVSKGINTNTFGLENKFGIWK